MHQVPCYSCCCRAAFPLLSVRYEQSLYQFSLRKRKVRTALNSNTKHLNACRPLSKPLFHSSISTHLCPPPQVFTSRGCRPFPLPAWVESLGEKVVGCVSLLSPRALFYQENTASYACAVRSTTHGSLLRREWLPQKELPPTVPCFLECEDVLSSSSTHITPPPHPPHPLKRCNPSAPLPFLTLTPMNCPPVRDTNLRTGGVLFSCQVTYPVWCPCSQRALF